MAKNTYIRKMQARKAAAEFTKSRAEEKAAVTAAERALWISLVAIHEAFGIGKDRIFRDYLPAFQKVSQEYEKRLREVDRDYADGKLEQEMKAIFHFNVEVGNATNEVKANGEKLY